MTKTIFILCDHGLGNRIGGLISGLKAAEITGARPILCWPIDNWCQAKFQDLFSYSIEIADDNFSLKLVDQIQHQKMPYFFVAGLNDDLTYANFFEHSLESLQKVHSESKKFVYATAKIPKSYIGKNHITDILSKLKINPTILNRVKSFCHSNKIDRDTIGLHIRKTDTGNMADEEFIFSYVSKEKNKTFFLCSDSKETENRFLQLPNVVVYPKNSEVKKLSPDEQWRQQITDDCGRNYLFNVNREKQQIIDAFIDMLILSRTTINRQSKSTFRAIAERFSTLELK